MLRPTFVCLFVMVVGSRHFITTKVL